MAADYDNAPSPSPPPALYAPRRWEVGPASLGAVRLLEPGESVEVLNASGQRIGLAFDGTAGGPLAERDAARAEAERLRAERDALVRRAISPLVPGDCHSHWCFARVEGVEGLMTSAALSIEWFGTEAEAIAAVRRDAGLDGEEQHR